MGWREELAAKVRAATAEGGWERSVYTLPWWSADDTGELDTVTVESKPLAVVAPGFDGRAAHPLIGSVNARAFADAASGCLLFGGFSTRSGGPPEVDFVLRRRPWNHFLFPDGGWREWRDRCGRLPFPEADFDALPA